MEQQVWSVQHARQSTLRPRVADPLKAGQCMISTPSSQVTGFSGTDDVNCAYYRAAFIPKQSQRSPVLHVS